MLRTAILFGVALLALPSAHAKKRIWPFVCAVHSADLIIVGSITALSEEYVTVRVEDRVFGTSEEQVTVAKWKEWACDERFAPYALGQKLLLLLTKGDAGYVPINASTGELQVRNDSVSVHFEGQRFALNELMKGMTEVRSCFEVVTPHGTLQNETLSQMLLRQRCPAQGTQSPGPTLPPRTWWYAESHKYLPKEKR